MLRKEGMSYNALRDQEHSVLPVLRQRGYVTLAHSVVRWQNMTFSPKHFTCMADILLMAMKHVIGLFLRKLLTTKLL